MYLCAFVPELKTTCSRRGIVKQPGKEKHEMNRVWTEGLAAVLVAVTETLIEVAKKLKNQRQTR